VDVGTQTSASRHHHPPRHADPRSGEAEAEETAMTDDRDEFDFPLLLACIQSAHAAAASLQRWPENHPDNKKHNVGKLRSNLTLACALVGLDARAGDSHD
jgi:hypothetical protein